VRGSGTAAALHARAELGYAGVRVRLDRTIPMLLFGLARLAWQADRAGNTSFMGGS
jgi:hypothetical protein